MAQGSEGYTEVVFQTSSLAAEGEKTLYPRSNNCARGDPFSPGSHSRNYCVLWELLFSLSQVAEVNHQQQLSEIRVPFVVLSGSRNSIPNSEESEVGGSPHWPTRLVLAPLSVALPRLHHVWSKVVMIVASRVDVDRAPIISIHKA